MKVAYFGIDALRNCLDSLLKHDCELVYIFTTEDSGYDSAAEIRNFAQMNGIPYKTTRATPQDIRDLEEQGVEYTITAGYPWLIPVSDVIHQVNIHPSVLPLGRGPWPMPVAILRGLDSGVTLHKLTEHYDEGDIILQREIPLAPEENLVTLMEKIHQVSVSLLDLFLDDPDRLWNQAVVQDSGEYWEEPSDEDRTIHSVDSVERAARVLRAFYGYGILCQIHGVTIEVQEARFYHLGEALPETPVQFALSDGVLVAERWQPYFRPIRLADRAALEAIRLAYPSELSDFTFPILYCWRKALDLQVFLGDQFYIIRGKDGYLCPIGEPQACIAYLRGLIQMNVPLSLRFCDSRYKEIIEEVFPSAQVTLSEDDCDYIIANSIMDTLEGSELRKRRNDLRHYASLSPLPEVEPITPDKLELVSAISAQVEGEDRLAEMEAIRHFADLGLQGVLVRRGERYVSFAMASEKQPGIMQGHFSKTIDTDRGANLFVVRACSVNAVGQYDYTNLEDDMGVPGLRYFKRSLHAQIIPSYTVAFSTGA